MTEGPPLQVCHIISTFRPDIGGAQRATETLCAELARRGCDVALLTRRYARRLPAFEVIHGIEVHRLGLPGLGKLGALSFGLHALWQLAARLRDHRIIHVQDADTSLLVGVLATLLLGRRLIATIHGEAPILFRRKTRLGRWRLALMVHVADRFTALNPRHVAELERLGIARERIHDIPNGVETAIFHPPDAAERARARRRLQLGDDDVVVLYLGRLVPFKRVDLLLDAWSRLPRSDARLLIVGTGPERERLEGVARSLGCTRVRFDGPTDDAIGYYQASDIFVLPSGDDRMSNFEGLSVALLEAMTVGLTPIVSACPGNDVLVRSEETGLTFTMGDSARLTGLLRRAIDSPELRRRLGHDAHVFATSTYSSVAVARETRRLYESTLEPNRLSARSSDGDRRQPQRSPT